jgi:hypothetical protein
MKDFRKGGITHGLIGGGFEGEEVIEPLAKLKKLLNLTDMKKADTGFGVADKGSGVTNIDIETIDTGGG